jgi:hypothetical protein
MLKNLLLFRKLIRQHKAETPETAQSWKYFSTWRQTLDKSKSSLDYGFPWFTFQAMEFINSRLKPGIKVFEYGGGSSTQYFIRKGGEVHTAEHHKGWFADLQKYFEKEGKSWFGFLLEAEAPATGSEPGNPLHYFSKDADYQSMNFKKYASKIDDYADQTFDIVLVDGRARPSCIYHSVPKVKSGGYLVVDNTERDYYTHYFEKNFSSQFVKELDVFGPVPYTEWFHKTTIWRKK